MNLDQVKAGEYELIAVRWDEITSKPTEPLAFVRHRRGDRVKLNVEEARRLVAAGAVRKPDSTPRRSGPDPVYTEGSDVADFSIKVLQQYVGEDPVKAAAVLQLEQARSEDARATLVDSLQKLPTASPSE